MDPSSTLSIPVNWVLTKVPLDIWRCLFHIIWQESSGAISEVLHLSHVCTSWRNTVQSTPELWSRIDVRVSLSRKVATPNIELLDLMTRNSQNVLLTMSLETDGNLTADIDQLFVLEVMPLFFHFWRAMERAKSINFNFTVLQLFRSYNIVELVRSIQAARKPRCGAPNHLQDLALTLPLQSRVITSIISHLWTSTLPIRSLNLNGADRLSLDHITSFEASSFPFRQLQRIAIGLPIDIAVVFHILSLTPSLLTAVFSVIIGFNKDFKPRSNVVLRSLEELSLCRQDDIMTEFPPFTLLLKFIIAPSLKTLKLQNDVEWSPGPFQTFLQNSSPRIERLHLDIQDSHQGDIIECLRLLPFLRILDLSVEDHIQLELCIGREFCTAMQEWDASNTAFSICPKLEKLTINYEALSYPFDTVFADMVENRWRRSTERHNFEVKIKDAIDHEEDEERLSEMIRLLILKQLIGLNVTIEPKNWLVRLFERPVDDSAQCL